MFKLFSPFLYIFSLIKRTYAKIKYADLFPYLTDSYAVLQYSFLMNIFPNEYPEYLKKVYYIKTKKRLNLKNPKTLNEKIQWLKIYDNLPIKTKLTDKVLVRSFVEEKIGAKYLKPVFWIGNSFDDIPFDKLPKSFVIKCNHGCKWHFIIKDKNKYLENIKLFNYTKNKIECWLSESFFGYSVFETQYKNIKPQIIIEKLMRDNINENPKGLQVWCVNSTPFIEPEEKNFREEAMYNSKILSKEFKLVRIDWMIYNNKIYFEEMTFTPLSGFMPDFMLKKDFFKKINNEFKINNKEIYYE